MTKQFKDLKEVIKHFRVTGEQNKKLLKDAREGGFKDVSKYIINKLGLSNE